MTRSALVAVAAAAIVAVLAALPPVARAAHFDHIVFTEGADVWRADANGANRIMIAAGDSSQGAPMAGPALSPDGQRVVYSRSCSGLACAYPAPQDVYIANLDGSNPRTVLYTGYDQMSGGTQWLPDGSGIVLNLTGGAGWDIYTVRTDGGGLSPLIAWPDAQVRPHVSPNGQQLTFASYASPSGVKLSEPHVFVTGIDGSNPRDLGPGFWPEFSPNGAKIAFTRAAKAGGVSVLHVVDVASGTITKLSRSSVGESEPTWTPDGARIAFVRSGDIYTIGADGRGEARLIDLAAAGGPSYRQPSTAVTLDDRRASELQPKLMFDSDERWRPIEVRSFLGETHRVCESGTCEVISTPEDLRRFPSAGARLDIEGNSEDTYRSPAPECNYGGLQDCDTGWRAAIYYHVSAPSPLGYRYLDYWWFYRYNDLPDIAFSDHEGDWEGISIAPSASTPGTFDFANFSAHGHWYSYLRDNLSCNGGSQGSCGTQSNKTGSRVSVFPAAGSHANYGEPCGGPCTQSNSAIPESDHDGARPWGRNNEGGFGDALRRFPATRPAGTAWTSGPMEWTDWPGLWSIDGGIASPGNQSHFHTPWVNECVDGSSCPVQTASTARRTYDVSNCESWFGGDVAAVACDERVLRGALRRRALGDRGAFALVEGGRRAASAPGVTQALADPLRPGERIELRGAASARTEVHVRVRSGRSLYRAKFPSVPLAGGRSRAIIEVGRGSRASGGRGARPAVTLRLPGRSRVATARVTRLRTR